MLRRCDAWLRYLLLPGVGSCSLNSTAVEYLRGWGIGIPSVAAPSFRGRRLLVIDTDLLQKKLEEASTIHELQRAAFLPSELGLRLQLVASGDARAAAAQLCAAINNTHEQCSPLQPQPALCSLIGVTASVPNTKNVLSPWQRIALSVLMDGRNTVISSVGGVAAAEVGYRFACDLNQLKRRCLVVDLREATPASLFMAELIAARRRCGDTDVLVVTALHFLSAAAIDNLLEVLAQQAPTIQLIFCCDANAFSMCDGVAALEADSIRRQHFVLVSEPRTAKHGPLTARGDALPELLLHSFAQCCRGGPTLQDFFHQREILRRHLQTFTALTPLSLISMKLSKTLLSWRQDCDPHCSPAFDIASVRLKGSWSRTLLFKSPQVTAVMERLRDHFRESPFVLVAFIVDWIGSDVGAARIIAGDGNEGALEAIRGLLRTVFDLEALTEIDETTACLVPCDVETQLRALSRRVTGSCRHLSPGATVVVTHEFRSTTFSAHTARMRHQANSAVLKATLNDFELSEHVTQRVEEVRIPQGAVGILRQLIGVGWDVELLHVVDFGNGFGEIIVPRVSVFFGGSASQYGYYSTTTLHPLRSVDSLNLSRFEDRFALKLLDAEKFEACLDPDWLPIATGEKVYLTLLAAYGCNPRLFAGLAHNSFRKPIEVASLFPAPLSHEECARRTMGFDDLGEIDAMARRNANLEQSMASARILVANRHPAALRGIRLAPAREPLCAEVSSFPDEFIESAPLLRPRTTLAAKRRSHPVRSWIRTVLPTAIGRRFESLFGGLF